MALLWKPLWSEVGKPSGAPLQAWPMSLGEKAGVPLQGALLPGVGKATFRFREGEATVPPCEEEG